MCVMTYDFTFPVTIFWLRHCEHKRVFFGIYFHFFGGVSSRAQRMHSVCISLHLDDIVFSTFIESILFPKRANGQDSKAWAVVGLQID